MAKPKKNSTKQKINLTVREEQRNKLEQMAAIEKRSVSNLIEVMADERWERLAGSRALLLLKPSRRRWTSKLTRTNQQTARNFAEHFSTLSLKVKGENRNGVV